MLIKRGRNTLMVLSFGKALVSPESRLKQKQPASSGEDTRLAVDFHLMIPRRIYQILPNRMAVIARCAISYVVLNCLFRIFAVFVNVAKLQQDTAISGQRSKNYNFLFLQFLNFIRQPRNFCNKQLDATFHFVHVGEGLEIELE